MKTKHITTFILAFMALFFITTSCDNSDPEQKPYKSYVKYNLDLGKDLLKFYDVKVNYTDAKGDIRSEKIDMESWVFNDESFIDFTSVSFIATATVKDSLSIGEGTNYDLGYKYDIRTYSPKTTAKRLNPERRNISVKAEDIEKYLQENKTINIVSFSK